MVFLGILSKINHFLSFFTFEVHFYKFKEGGLSLFSLSMRNSDTGQFLGTYQNPYCFCFRVIAPKAWYINGVSGPYLLNKVWLMAFAFDKDPARIGPLTQLDVNTVNHFFFFSSVYD